MNAATVIDAIVEGPIVPSFTRFGFDGRRRLFRWTELGSCRLGGRVIGVTGATSGLGRSAELLGHGGATVIVVGRNPVRTAAVVAEIRGATGDADASAVVSDNPGRFVLDRGIRRIHRLGSTRHSDAPELRDNLGDWVADRAGCSPSARPVR